MQDKNIVLDIVKGMAIFLVICGHLIQRSLVVLGQDYFSNPVFKCIYMFHMPLFFFVSGYLMAYSLKKHPIGDLLRSRAWGLMVPFFSWGLLGIGVACVLNRADLARRGVAAVLFDPAQLPIWFIWFLLTLFLSTGLLLASVWLKSWLGKFAFPVGLALLWAVPVHGFLSFYYVKWFYLFYLAGYVVSRHGADLVRRLNHWIVMGVALGLFVFLALHWTKNDFVYVNQMRLGFLNGPDVLRLAYRYLVGFLGIALVFFIGERLSRHGAGRLLSWVGFYSLDIYLIQRYLVEGGYPRVYQLIPVRFDLNTPFVLGVVVPAMAVLCLTVCLFFSRAFIRKNIGLNRWLLGNRG